MSISAAKWRLFLIHNVNYVLMVATYIEEGQED